MQHGRSDRPVSIMLEENNQQRQLKNTKFWLFFLILGSTCSAKKWSLKTATKGTKYDISKVPDCSNVLISKYHLKKLIFQTYKLFLLTNLTCIPILNFGFFS